MVVADVERLELRSSRRSDEDALESRPGVGFDW
jgi:hypothetical protein